ncbi:hypothetical protein HN695_05915 [Candidatus Woesearchaeota archaeon]|nr:hypothetical protein [Candidatus Woesearchaeota archaeon]MBT5272583.1 hypothetical protein [Candidatus Woesearchaeota archaeon]MBT6040560.1 hypothetical protein [Candidatus Woesearchaeota archaeon]MBT6337135.1 hypothetical protein [Candidatus Woesearchaeota archaeon]MBT7927845.1 hypothetical protein [Candidatus Woesearchaeota archaeon]
MQTNNQKQRKIGRLERITLSTAIKKITKGIAIVYGVAIAAGIGYFLGQDTYQDVKAYQSPACQEISCSPTFHTSCYKRVTTKENADHCVVNDKNEEECCACKCYWDYML